VLANWNQKHFSKQREDSEFCFSVLPRRSEDRAFLRAWRTRLGNEGAADAQTALRRALRPNWLETDAHGRKYGDMQHCQDIFGEIFLVLQFDGDTAET
jgi:hypothetical protein